MGYHALGALELRFEFRGAPRPIVILQACIMRGLPKPRTPWTYFHCRISKTKLIDRYWTRLKIHVSGDPGPCILRTEPKLCLLRQREHQARDAGGRGDIFRQADEGPASPSCAER